MKEYIDNPTEIKMNNYLLQNSNFKKLRGNHYLILTMLHIYPKGLTSEALKEKIANSNTNKCCLSRNTLKSILTDLLNEYISCNKSGLYKLIDDLNFGLGYTSYSSSATTMLINGIIKQQDYLVYLCLVRNLQQNRNVSYATLANDTGIDKGNMSKYINNLYGCKLIKIDKSYNKRGLLSNSYSLVE